MRRPDLAHLDYTQTKFPKYGSSSVPRDLEIRPKFRVMADFTQQGHDATNKRRYDEYSADGVGPQQGGGYFECQVPPFTSVPVPQVFGPGAHALASSGWSQPWSCENNSILPVHSWPPGNLLLNNYAAYEHSVQQWAVPLVQQPTLPAPDVNFSNAPIHGLWYEGQNSIQQGNVRIGYQNPQDYTKVTVSLDTTNQSTSPPDANLVCFGMVYQPQNRLTCTSLKLC